MTQSENTDAIWKRAEIQSPCVKICVVHPEARLCIGCYRTIDEIAGWSRMATAFITASVNVAQPQFE